MSKKSKILIVGGTGYIGKRIVNASLDQGHPTYILMRRENCFDIEKLQMLLSFKEKGARLVEGSFSDHQSLVDAVKQVDVVICTMPGVQGRPNTLGGPVRNRKAGPFLAAFKSYTYTRWSIAHRHKLIWHSLRSDFAFLSSY